MANTLTRTVSDRDATPAPVAVAALLRRIARSLGFLPEVSLDVQLEEGRAWSRRIGGGGARLRCVAGSALLTREGDPLDHVLTAGDCFKSELPGRVALLALEPTKVVIAGHLRGLDRQVH